MGASEVDFSKLGTTKKASPLVDPIAIFASLPSLAGTPNDLWRGQDRALSEWHAERKKQDVLVSLNTGAGKTIVGLLIAQSLVGEGLSNVVYVCSTIDLVMQTSQEAKRIGIDHTTRVGRRFSDDLFETGKAFCITTYAALFNGHSALRRRHFPGAVVFDDAHVAESLLRDALTLRIDVQEHGPLFEEIAALFEPHFRKIGASGQFRDARDMSRRSTAFVAPGGLFDRREQLVQILLAHGVKDHDTLGYPFAWLEDHVTACTALFTRGVFELSPPFLPSLALDIFQQDVRRVYMSATLQSQADFVRAFGRLPDVTISPLNDAGNGERLVVAAGKIPGGFGVGFTKCLISTRKAVVAVPDYERAKEWSGLATPPSRDSFSHELNTFRAAEAGAFVLVSRVDGIDLPNDTCRIMVIQGLPAGASLLERYQAEYLRMHNVQAVRIANRLAQLFGRINRGRNDYGAFLLEGDDLAKWMGNDRNLALLPPLLQKQILMGREVQTEFDITHGPEAVELVDKVLARDRGWLDYYQREVKLAELDAAQLARHQTAEPALVAAAESEAKYAAAMWIDDVTTARLELEKTIDVTARHDTPLGGWHSVWLGAAYEREGDAEAASAAYERARQRLGNGITLPRFRGRASTTSPVLNLNAFGRSLQVLLCHGDGHRIEADVRRLSRALGAIEAPKADDAEAAVRVLGEALGFNSTRPDNDEGIGPDVLWRDDLAKQYLGLELKTEKTEPVRYHKKDIGQGHNHVTWMTDTYPDHGSVGMLFVGPDGRIGDRASPSSDMALCTVSAMAGLRNALLALIDDLRSQTPIERLTKVHQETADSRWSLQQIAKRLRITEFVAR